VDLEERSGLGGDVDSGVRSTLGRRGSDAHLTMVHLEDTTARSAPGGYWVDAAVEDREHRLVKPGRRVERGGSDSGESAPTVNGTISTDCKRDGI
jgi:hypothetical protein